MHNTDVTHKIFRQNRIFKSYERLIATLPEFGEWLTNPGNAGLLDNVIKQVSTLSSDP